MSYFRAGQAELESFERDGYLIARSLFSRPEADVLLKVAKADHDLQEEARSLGDGTGGISKLSLRNDLSDNMYSAVVRCPRVVDSMELFLGGEVYHYHHKMMLKEPRVGGAWQWHQDYGYWYNNDCLFPYMASCMISVDAATKENGCLQVIKGSHHLGRVDHGQVGGQTGADAERVEEILKRLPLVYVELDPGDAVFFHSNLLHRSDKNSSDKARWTLICCYNAARNDPFRKGYHPNYSKLEKWPEERVLEMGKAQLARQRGKALDGAPA